MVAAGAAVPAPASDAITELWSRLVVALPVGEGGAATRSSVFDQLDTDSDGSLSLMELEAGLPGALGGGGARSSHASLPILRSLISQAFETTKGFGSSSLVVSDAACSRDEFTTLAAYLHVACTLYAHLKVDAADEALPTMGEPAFEQLSSSVPATWHIDTAEALRAFRGFAGWATGAVRGEEATHALVVQALPTLIPDLYDDEAALPGRTGGCDFVGKPPLPPPPGGLEPVLESTERSAFSSTGDWGKQLGSGSGTATQLDSDLEREGTLGRESGLGSVKMGFFDASTLEDAHDDDELAPRHGGGGASTQAQQAKYAKVVAECAQAKAEVERLKAELTQARSDEEHQRSQHRINVKKMLQANEALQAQLKELNGVVERVVQKELGRPGGGKAGGPPPVFPAKAKPGSKVRQPQAPPGAMPFK